MFGPIIEGEACRLRPPRLDEAPAMVTWFQDQTVTAALKARTPLSLEEEEAWLRRMASSPDDVLWAIEREGGIVGNSAIHGIDWTDRHGSTGTVIGDRRHWGRGVGRESMRLRTRYAFTQLPLHKLCSAYHEGNEASRRAQLAAGYREVGRRREHIWREGRWHDLVLTEILREEWAATQRIE
jgi:RimJ/RimL family protein N-acetyltransferase